jgi:hypothetical protein
MTWAGANIADDSALAIDVDQCGRRRHGGRRVNIPSAPNAMTAMPSIRIFLFSGEPGKWASI